MDSFALLNRHIDRVIQNNAFMANSHTTNSFLNNLLQKGGGLTSKQPGLPSGGGFTQKKAGLPDGNFSKRHPVMQEMMDNDDNDIQDEERQAENANNIITQAEMFDQEGEVFNRNNEIRAIFAKKEKRIEGVVVKMDVTNKSKSEIKKERKETNKLNLLIFHTSKNKFKKKMKPI